VPPATLGHYRLETRIGHGGMGEVYRAFDTRLNRLVAIKVMRSEEDRELAVDRFLREARAASVLDHPNIVVIHEVGGTPEGDHFIVQELIEGSTLRALIDGPMPLTRIAEIGAQIARALSAAHTAGIVHRDVKPSNVFLPRDRPAKVMDFGVARLAGGTTTGGMMVGTPNYMSPEQVRAAPDLDGRSDLFSVGLILYELVTGEKAYAADTLIAVLYKIANEEPNLELIPQGPSWKRLRHVLGRALAKKPSERYADAAAMADEVAEALRDLGGKADPHFSADQILRFRGARGGTGSPTSPAGTPSPGPAVPVTTSPAGRETQTLEPSPASAPPAPPDLRSTVAEAVILHPPQPREEPGGPGHRRLFMALGAIALLAFGAGLALLPRRAAAPPGPGAPITTSPARAAPTARPAPADSPAPPAAISQPTTAPTTLTPATTPAPSSVPPTTLGAAPIRAAAAIGLEPLDFLARRIVHVARDGSFRVLLRDQAIDIVISVTPRALQRRSGRPHHCRSIADGIVLVASLQIEVVELRDAAIQRIVLIARRLDANQRGLRRIVIGVRRRDEVLTRHYAQDISERIVLVGVRITVRADGLHQPVAFVVDRLCQAILGIRNHGVIFERLQGVERPVNLVNALSHGLFALA
jgi:serine/threonine protein kinase